MEYHPKMHRAFGVYGFFFEKNRLLVINKKGGSYTNHYDLPGGSLEDSESLPNALRREFLEETGMKLEIIRNIGVIDFILPWDWKEYTHVHHICVFYEVEGTGGLTQPMQFEGQDSLGALWISEHEATFDNASPLVVKAFEWLKTEKLGIDAECYEHWKVKGLIL
ncbi:NUDIX hydrolase [Bacillus infantis]|uniref:NUDIX hydrolase n=1 Tax=Bacillus infantis TaxID=324767 RepID=UPI001CD389D7|nr:NUDIX hydrolase [Bacillus infantis]MCA1037945.1 NUDIX hydrolase [Bacillus infantis]